MTRHFGILIPSTNRTIEIEFTRLIPESLQFHTARMGRGGDTVFARLRRRCRLPVEDARQCESRSHQSHSNLGELVRRKLNKRIKALITEHTGAPAYTSAEAIGAAARALGTRKIALVSPYSEQVIGQAKNYFEADCALGW